MKTILITGATAGIGKATAQLFTQKGNRVIITGRREERLFQLQEEIHQQYNNSCYILSFDVRDRDVVQHALIDEGLYSDWDAMIDTNVKGLLYVTEAVLPLMPNGSHIINVSSVAGLQSYPGGNVYCASKHAVEGLSNGMRIDLLKRNINRSYCLVG